MTIPKDVSDQADALVERVLNLPPEDATPAILGLAVLLLNWGAYKLRQGEEDALSHEFRDAAQYFETLASENGYRVNPRAH